MLRLTALVSSSQNFGDQGCSPVPITIPITTQPVHADGPVYGYSDTVIRGVVSLEELALFRPICVVD
jgi:hypothetical protein